jgi:hypothetical protein
MSSTLTIREQFRRNAVALISLAIAVTSLGYNTWRNEASEHNRNQRVISIEILLMLSELQQVILDRRYGKESEGKSNLRKGWVIALTIRDISMIAEGGVPESAERLFSTWEDESGSLGSSDEAKERIENALKALRRDTQDILRNLD